MSPDTTLHPDDLSDEQRQSLRSSLEELQEPGAERTSGTLRIRDEEVPLPDRVLRLITQALGDLAEGRAVSLIAADRGLTTSQAAAMLDVSRPHLVKLLEEGEIPFHTVGSHRRIEARDLQAYKERREAEAEEAYSELVQQAQELDMGYETPSE